MSEEEVHAGESGARQVSETVKGECELCGCAKRLLHRELPNRFYDCGQEWIWVCAPCGRMNTAINSGRAICCTDHDPDDAAEEGKS